MAKIEHIFGPEIFFLDFSGFFLSKPTKSISAITIVPLVFTLNRYTGLFAGYKDNSIVDKTATRGSMSTDRTNPTSPVNSWLSIYP